MSKTASLIFFYFGEDSYVKRLAQETMKLHWGFEGYDKQVLLRHQTKFGHFEVSEQVEKKADVVDLPTKENLAKYLNELGDEGYVVDVYIFSHGYKGQFRVSKGTYANNESVTDDWLLANVRPLKIRAVWQCNCFGASMADCWHALGAKVVAGSRFVNYYPTRWLKFIKLWNKGERFSSAVSKSDTKEARGPSQLYMQLDAPTCRDVWDGPCPPGKDVLGRHDCAKRYFVKRWWWDENDWQPDQSGRQNMNYQSHMIVSGTSSAKKLTKHGKLPTW